MGRLSRLSVLLSPILISFLGVFFLVVSSTSLLYSQESNRVIKSDRLIDRVSDLSKVLDEYDYDRVIRAIKRDPQKETSLEYRILLFKAYLGERNFVLATENLAYIKSRRDNYKTKALEALFDVVRGEVNEEIGGVLERGDYLQSAKEKLFEIKREWKSYPDAYLLLHKIYLSEGLLEHADQELRGYKRLVGSSRKWYNAFCDGLIKKIGKNEQNQVGSSVKSEKIKKRLLKEFYDHLVAYQKEYEKDHHFFFCSSVYLVLRYGNQSNAKVFLNRSLKLINKALKISPAYNRFQNQKMTVLYEFKDRAGLNRYLHELISNKRGELLLPSRNFQLKYWKLLLDINKPTNKSFNQVLSILEESPQNEVVRYLAEDFLLRNKLTPLAEKKVLADFRYEQAKRFLSQGQYKNAGNAIAKSKLLFPEDIRYHSFYLELLRITKRYRDAIGEIDKIMEYRRVLGMTNDTVAYQLSMKQAIANKKNKDAIYRKYRLEPLPSMDGADGDVYKSRLAYPRVGIISSPPVLFDKEVTISSGLFSYENSYNRWVFTKMLLETLKNTLPYTFELMDTSRNDLSKVDYLIDFDFDDKVSIVNLDLKVKNLSSHRVVTNRSLNTKGTTAYSSMIENISLLLDGLLPRVGRVVRLENEDVVLDLGRLAGVTEKSKFKFFFIPEDTVLSDSLMQDVEVVAASYSVKSVDDYFTVIQIESRRIRNKISVKSAVDDRGVKPATRFILIDEKIK